MTSPFDNGLLALRELQARETDQSTRNRNEATTRLQIIDRIFFECLGWERSDCTAEESYNGTYSDYIFRAQGANLLVEAKREGTYFELPVGLAHRVYEIAYFEKNAPLVYSAIEQAVDYCTKRGIQFGVVSNGNQLIAFLGSRTDGTPPMNGKSLVFASLNEMNEQFLRLWQTLSKSGVQYRNLLSELRAGLPSPPPEKLSARLIRYPGYQTRNSLQIDLQILAEILIQDIGKEPDREREFLERCYTENGALSQYALVSRAILAARYSQLSQAAASGPEMFSATTKSGVNPQLFGDPAAKRPILLVGDIGVGKTTFIRNLINVAARDLLEKSIVLYIDLGVKPTMRMDLDRFIADEITRQLRTDHAVDIEEAAFLQGVYNIELQTFEKGIWGSVREADPAEFARRRAAHLQNKIDDTHEHLRRCLDHIVKARQKQVVIFFDNLDQRSDDFQQDAFLLGQSVAELWPAMVFMTLRPETYHRSRATGTLSAYHQRAFTIAPPRIDRVLEKRLQYGVELLETGQLKAGDVSISSTHLQEYLEVLTSSFQTNNELIEFIDNVCGGNVRLALDFVKVFIGSGHVDTVKIIDIYHSDGRYIIPLHEFLRAVIYGDHFWFDPTASEIKNVFDVSERDGREHFLILCALAFLERRGQTSDTDGYVLGEEALEHLNHLGFRTSQVMQALKRVVRWKLIEPDIKTMNSNNEEESLATYYRLTTIGAYYFRKLVSTFQYLDAVVVDTPVMDSEARTSILDARSIAERLDRAARFCTYLDGQWGDLGDSGSVFDWTSTAIDVRRDIEQIRERLARGPRQQRFRTSSP